MNILGRLNALTEKIEGLIYGEDYLDVTLFGVTQNMVEPDPMEIERLRNILIASGVPEDVAEERSVLWGTIGTTTDEVSSLLNDGFDTEQVEVLLITNLTTTEAREWTDRGFSLTDREFGSWFASFQFAETARAWRDSGFDADEALMWDSVHASPEQAITLRGSGLTPELVLQSFHKYVVS